MSTSEFDKYKVDHLFLLIGENPLPNYVAAMLLLKSGGTAYLVHTTHTVEAAKRLQTILNNEKENEQIRFQEAQRVSLNDYESDAFHIKKEISDKLNTIANGTLGLNYTGGTKAMAVHAYRSIFSNNCPGTIFSYLDPRRLEMCIDREDRERIHRKVKPEVLQVKLTTVFDLHGWNWGKKQLPTYKPELPEAARTFAEFHVQENTVIAWRTWCDDVLRPAARKPTDKNKWQEENKLKEVSALSLDTLKSHEAIKSALTYLGVVDDALKFQTVKNQGIENLKAVCKWLDGEWLEHYVLHQIQNISEVNLIHESATSFKIKNPNSPKNDKFEFDVAFIRGYQLFAISCTTDLTKSLCKSKLFEAYIRAQQLGGSEARIALVCCASNKDVKALETEIVNVFNPDPDSGKRDHKVVVFGRDDLMDLSSKIEEWIKQNDREAR